MSFAATVKAELKKAAEKGRRGGEKEQTFLREAFLRSGSMSDPSKGYHLEFVCAGDDEAQGIVDAARALSVDMKVTKRGGHTIVYLKDGEEIVTLLGLMGAHVSLMQMENERIVKEVRGMVNRRVNCETANITKTVSAAAKQVADIEFIRAHANGAPLEETLSEMARLRTDYPDATLSELGQMCRPPIGKSGVNHRLRRLSEIARRLREETALLTDSGRKVQ